MELIPISVNTATSADFTLTDGQSTTIFLKDAESSEVTPTAVALVQIKSDTSYFTIGKLDVVTPGRVLQAPGTFRVLKFNSPVAFGVDRV
jgi:hypothetical protein